MSAPLQPEVVAAAGPLTSDQIRASILNLDYGARKTQAMTMGLVSLPIALYGFARRATWAKTVGMAGLLLAGLAYMDLRRLDLERNTAQRAVLS